MIKAIMMDTRAIFVCSKNEMRRVNMRRKLMRDEEYNDKCAFSTCDNVAAWHVIDTNDDCFMCEEHKKALQKE